MLDFVSSTSQSSCPAGPRASSFPWLSVQGTHGGELWIILKRTVRFGAPSATFRARTSGTRVEMGERGTQILRKLAPKVRINSSELWAFTKVLQGPRNSSWRTTDCGLEWQVWWVPAHPGPLSPLLPATAHIPASGRRPRPQPQRAVIGPVAGCLQGDRLERLILIPPWNLPAATWDVGQSH